MGRLKTALVGAADRLGNARLPVRLSLPSNEELAAAGLTTLAVGLAVGLVIGPGVQSGFLMPLAAPPLVDAASPATEPETILPELGSPAGSSGNATPAGPVDAALVSSGPTTSPAPAPVPAPVPAPLEQPTGPPPKGSAGGGGGTPGDPDTFPMVATVVSVSVTGRAYAAADRFGNLFSVFADRVPKIGTRIKTGIKPLSNGTFLESAKRRVLGKAQQATIRGVVSYFELVAGVVVVSSRGASLALHGPSFLEMAGPTLRIAANAEARVSFEPGETVTSDGSGPDSIPEKERVANLRILEIGFLYSEGTAVELTGKLEKLDRTGGTVQFSADSAGLLSRSVVADLPPDVPPGLLKVGSLYSVTLREGRGGALRLTGFSPAWGGKQANDPALGYGEQGS